MADPNDNAPDLPVTVATSASPVEQAAIVLLCMGEEPAAAVLRHLSREELLEVTQEMSRLSGIKVETVKQAMQRFFDNYREQSGVHGASRSYLKRSLDLALGSQIAGSVLNSIYGDAIRPKMQRLQWAAPKWLAERIAHEHVRMQAVFLAFLPPQQASRVIEGLPADERDQLLLSMARLQEIDNELLTELDEIVSRCLDEMGTQSATVEGTRQVAEILNRLTGDKRGMVETLRERDAELTGRIEASMYDFFILSNQTEAVLTRILDEVPLEQWATALKGAEPGIRDAILTTMPRRQAQTFQDLLRRAGPVPLSRVEQARRDIMAQVKALADAGEIEVRLFAETTVE